ncbi:MAG TPA: SURF1 family protein [Candidatus Sulfotelmatobacter sp.]|jgi:surfeit locus 1 family protein|nr:SURF1 family protein [Candidatus Sulfotelmatobacter sp.]
MAVRHFLVAVLLSVLIGLGTWQVQRLIWKTELIATMDRRMHQAPVDVGDVSGDEDMNYRSAAAAGRFLEGRAFYQLAIATGSGEGGYRVLRPMQLEDGRFLLVDRGWEPYGLRGKEGTPSGRLTVHGVLRMPERHWSQPANDPGRDIWYGSDLPLMARLSGLPVLLPYVLEADAAPNVGGYPVGGQSRVSLPNDHLGYALTWYGLALALLIVHALSMSRKDVADCKETASEGLSPRLDEAGR